MTEYFVNDTAHLYANISSV